MRLPAGGEPLAPLLREPSRSTGRWPVLAVPQPEPDAQRQQARRDPGLREGRERWPAGARELAGRLDVRGLEPTPL